MTFIECSDVMMMWDTRLDAERVSVYHANRFGVTLRSGPKELDRRLY